MGVISDGLILQYERERERETETERQKEGERGRTRLEHKRATKQREIILSKPVVVDDAKLITTIF